ncbi:MAG: hypothetical protein I3J02_09870 [Prevotella sp.]|nr:hypothetical protein [Prevotella sp.]
MAGPPMLTGPFALPMMKAFVPRKAHPWIYLLFAIVFQMTSAIYLGNLSHMMGEWGLMREDVMFVGMCGILGVAMPFPVLFRLKFRYTNRSLLLFSVGGMIMCNYLVLLIHWMPLLCVINYACCFMKLMATFEILSNIQLWMTPRRDFRVFFPLIYIIILCDMSLGGWMAEHLAYYFGTWKAMQWFIIATQSLIWLFIYGCTKHFRFMKPLPFISVDWLGCVLWSVLMLQVIWIFEYAEFYNWFDSTLWTTVVLLLPLTAAVTIQRMLFIRHPYIDPRAFQYKTLIPLLFMFAVAEVMNSSPQTLQNIFTGTVQHYGAMATSRLDLVCMVGYITGSLFSLWWMKMLRFKYTRLLTIGFFFLLLYQVWMYFLITPMLNIERLYFPTFIRTFGYAIFFSTLTIYLEDLMPFQHFFMGLTICGFIRNGVVATVSGAFYGYGMRYYVADNLGHGFDIEPLQAVMMALKQLYGITCVGGTIFLLLLMLWHVNPVRSTLGHLPYWNKLGQQMRRELAPKTH